MSFNAYTEWQSLLLCGDLRIKLFLLAIFCGVVASANAVTSIGTTPLLYGNSNASDVLMSRLDVNKISDPNTKLGVRRIILSEIVKQMVGFQPILDATLTESGSYAVYDAKPIVQNWKNANPKQLDIFYKTTSVIVQTNEHTAKVKAESSDNGKPTAPASVNAPVVGTRRFVLLGFVDSIHEKETRTPIQGTDKVVFIYSLDIRCEYRLVNPDTNRVAAVFIGAGHGGIARILGAGHPPVNFDAKLIVGDMFDNLAENVHHILLLRRAEYIKKRINAKRITIQTK